MNAMQRAGIECLAQGKPMRVAVPGRIGMFHNVDPPIGLSELAQVVLELASKQRFLTFPSLPLTGTVTATSTAFAPATSAAPGDCANSGTLDVSAAAEGPITTAELIRRGCDDELEARALDVVLRCGWPRPDVDLTTGPCIPVPVAVLQRWREKYGGLSDDLHFELGQVLRHQDRVQGLYIDALPDGPLPEVQPL